jgi:cytochrome c biogenesis protein
MRKLVTVDVGGRQLLTEQPVPVDLGFALHCDDFSVSFYDNGMPKEYKSIITVLKEGKPVQGYSQVQVIVNDPLSYGGINFYQSSYGYVTENPWFKITVTSRRDGASSQVKVHQGERFSLPGGGFARVLEATDEVSSFYPAFRGPALRLEQTLPGSRPEVVMLMLNYPDFDQQRSGSLGYTLNDFQMYTGLQVAKDPGVGVVWLGCILMVLGILIAFFLSHQRIWLTIENAGGKSRVSFGGVAHRNQPAFEQLFSTLREGINSRI